MSDQNNLPESNKISPEAVLPKIIRERIFHNLIYAAAKLGIADILADGPKSCEELAKSVEAHPQTLYRVLRALASGGIFAETGDGRFELTPIAAPLRSDIPGSVRNWAILTGEEWFWRPFGKLLHSVKTGENAFSHIYGMGFFDYLKKDSDAAKIFDNLMTNLTGPKTTALAGAYDFSGFSRIVDIGGGQGTLIAAILKTYPQAHGVLFDLPHVIDKARNTIKTKGLVDRCELIPGDMFESVPEGDAIILKWILHDWDDLRSIAILKNCRRAITENGRLLLIEGVVPPGNEPSQVKLDDIAMLAVFGGAERTAAQFSALFDAAGFKLLKILPTESQWSIIEAVPV